MTARKTIRPTHPTASQKRMPRGFLTRMSSESRVSLWRDTTSSSMAARPGTWSERSRPEARVASSSRSSGIDHSLVTLGSTTVNMKSMMNWSTT